MTRQRGAALLLVMWLILLLGGLVAGYAMGARIESMQGRGLARTVAASEAARAGVEYAMARMLDTDAERRWTPDGGSHQLQLGDAEVEVSVRDEMARIDLNAASFDLLAGLFAALGQEQDKAQRLAGAVVDWRDADELTQPAGGAEDPDYAAAGLAWGAKDAAFETVGELEQVLGMTPDLFAAAEPHLTVLTGRAVPSAPFADPVVLQAMGIEPPEETEEDENAPPRPGSGTYSIDSRARLADGRSAKMSVVLRAGGSLPGSTYTPLRWREGIATP